MRVYIDTSAAVAKLFGKTVAPARHNFASQVFNFVEQGKIVGIISFYTLHEIYWFCIDNFPIEQAKKKARFALFTILGFNIELAPLVAREDRIVYSRRLPISDTSDQMHAISAFTNGCDAIVAYDDHFQEVSDVIEYLKPEELIQRVQGTK